MASVTGLKLPTASVVATGARPRWPSATSRRAGDLPTMATSIRMAAAGTRARLFMRSLLGIGAILVDYFKGAIHVARFTRRALPASEFLTLPSRWSDRHDRTQRPRRP